MEVVYTIFAFLFGMVFGSFFNVVGLRVPLKMSISYPSSHCTNCMHRLSALDLIPIFSYIFLKGKCRYCGQKVSPIYMVTEILTGILFAFAYWQLGFTPELIVALLFISLLAIIVVSDIAYMIIPDKVLLFFLPLLALGRIIAPSDPWWDSLLGPVVGFTVLFLVALLSKGGMGGGDIKLFFLIGLALGTIGTLVTLFFASVIGMIVGIVILKVRGQDRKQPIPFGPSIALAAIIVYFYGDRIIDWYINIL
ncbi:prepilin peptidase [Ureibacillus acetophenoni]|uniref:Type 4 prepilin peptidase 1 n=1 Tax=Ureibacillus acetophenoni TaxID=614649 RepID=A0A285U8V2_9BACL|nr:A24 family peptidase [Ureibacillus acetophenoni]SOC38249.1 type 4 prepilin peptidase 1 [Ureibacillus acetophenoni]